MRLLVLLALVTGCAADTGDDWVYRYRINQLQVEGCTLASSTNLDLVRLKGKECVEGTWCHPCQDGTPGLCPDLSAPGEWTDVYSREAIDNPADYIVIEACR